MHYDDSINSRSIAAYADHCQAAMKAARLRQDIQRVQAGRLVSRIDLLLEEVRKLMDE